eukprot:TRINITY_DN50265_c0_g1_i1.p1 TRINITY_DN50265_c0_g1~~TRINITY_DN50265_c0_g1_i1.p1  ORF type:complete len:688 (+),score=134.84 TRINITY_DN50265_c0_g1_i1:26-2065(+)
MYTASQMASYLNYSAGGSSSSRAPKTSRGALCPEPGDLRPSSITGMRAAMMAVLREAALHELAALVLQVQLRAAGAAMRNWHDTAHKVTLALQHARAGALAAEEKDKLHGKHEDDAAAFRRTWQKERKALVSKLGTPAKDEDIRQLQVLDRHHRQQIADLQDSHKAAHEDHDARHEEAHAERTRRMKVMCFSALQGRMRQSSKCSGCWPQGDNASVCFLQWAFTDRPEVWSVPFPPVLDLKHATALAEQRVSLAAALRMLFAEARSLRDKAALAAEAQHCKQRRARRMKPGAATSKSASAETKCGAIAARLLRRSLQRALHRTMWPCLQRLLLMPPRRRTHSHAAHRLEDLSHIGAEETQRAEVLVEQKLPYVLGEVSSKTPQQPHSHLDRLPPIPPEVTEAAAVKIQSRVRGKSARASTAQLREQKHGAAVKIQSRVRGKRVREAAVERQAELGRSKLENAVVKQQVKLDDYLRVVDEKAIGRHSFSHLEIKSPATTSPVSDYEQQSRRRAATSPQVGQHAPSRSASPRKSADASLDLSSLNEWGQAFPPRRRAGSSPRIFEASPRRSRTESRGRKSFGESKDEVESLPHTEGRQVTLTSVKHAESLPPVPVDGPTTRAAVSLPQGPVHQPKAGSLTHGASADSPAAPWQRDKGSTDSESSSTSGEELPSLNVTMDTE